MGLSETFRRDYAPAFLQFLSQRSEAALAAAYELGRNAMARRLSMLELVEIHHALLLKVLRTSRGDEDLEDIAGAAAAFFVEVLATFEMAQRGFLETRREASLEPGPGPQQRTLPHSVTEHAIGMVMERQGLTAEAALDWMRTSARANRVDVEQVAARLVQRRPLGTTS